MPPRKSTKKQTRLAFAPSATPPAGDASPDQSNSYARLKYDDPSLGSYRSPKLRKSKTETSPAKKRSKVPSVPPDNLEEVDDLPDPKELYLKKPRRSSRSSKKDIENTNALDPKVDPPRKTLKRKAASSPIVSSDSDEPIASSAVKRSRPTPGGDSSSTPVVLSDDDDDDDDDEAVAPSTARRRRAARSAAVLNNDDDDDDSEGPLPSSPIKRLRRGQEKEAPQTPHTPRQISQQARLDIEEDLEDLQDSVVKKSRTRGRLAESARDRRMKHLEALRRRRAGLKEEDQAEEEDEEEEEDESEYDSDVQEIAQPNAKPNTPSFWHNRNEDSDVESAVDPNEDLDRYEDDFVLEDETNDLGVPTEEIPFEFTRHAYKQPKEYFRDVIGWMVQNKLNPAFPRSDAMYEMAFMKLEDEVKGRAGSQLISSVWTPAFIYALQARPHMDIYPFTTEEDIPCAACRRSKHPASSDMRLRGKAYSLQTLEPLEDENDSDDSDSDGDQNKESAGNVDGEDRDRDGHVLPPENYMFFLGSQCKARAALAHTLTHWRYHLNEWVIDYLERTGHMDDDEILRRNNLSIKRRTRNANDVLDSMTAAGEVDRLWRDFHINLKSAREKEVCFIYFAVYMVWAMLIVCRF
ncbi:uncharacterized protein N7515_004582 [Penicillium bovifimosum]|uniref:DUF4211 domain-containing protein n=1 Tax=Penicillium bovifimosum TaxID=126998 RepID=A0A9W9H0E6_9EURO|nr:uncharacterized protein N7515_004582 [Penicillium bovifimosum]KAJ5135304.1 hypothetical protein N7515_004582 [Penicillium bovifimosum]